MLPEGWKYSNLGEFASNITSGSRDWAQYYSDTGDKFVRMTNLARDGVKISENDMKFVSIPHDSTDGKRTALKNGDILISITAELGKIGLVPNGFGTAFINQHLALVRLKTATASSTFVAYALSSKKLNQKLNSLNDAGAKAGLNLSTIRSIPILLPPLPEQKKIAAILSTWDRAIEGTEKLLANSQQQKKALMQQLLTGKKRLPGFTGEWKSLKLKTFLQESIIPSPQPDPKKRITVRLSLNGVEKREVRGTESIDATNYFTRKAGQFIYGKQNIHKGAFGIIPKILDGFETSQDIPCFDFLPNACSEWLFYYLARENIHNTLETKMTGTGSKRLNQKTFLNLTCLAPPLSEQKAIAAVLTTADEEITALESDLSRLRQEKKALMQQLLTGKIRVAV